MLLLTIILGIVAVVIMLFIFGFAIIGAQYISWFHFHVCKHCKHTMEYRGLKDDDKGGHYLFHCSKCGRWESIPKEEFFDSVEGCYDPNEVNI